MSGPGGWLVPLRAPARQAAASQSGKGTLTRCALPVLRWAQLAGQAARASWARPNSSA